MDLRQLQYFVTIVEENSITKAAEKLHLAQPALSKQLRALEEDVGERLIERTTRSIRVTEAGRLLAYRAAQMLNLAETTKREIRDHAEGLRGTLRIGTMASAGSILLPQRIADFSRAHPQTAFQTRDLHTPEILELLDHGLVDIGIVRSPLDTDKYDAILLPEEPMMAVCAGVPFWHEDQAYLELSELKDHPVLVHNRYAQTVANLCRKEGFEPQFLGQIDDTRTLLLCAQTGMGVALVQRDWLNLTGGGHLKAIRINADELVTRTAVIWQKGRYLPTVARRFLETFKGETS